MKFERLERLLWEFRDGAITAEERSELLGYLEQHPDARELQREIEDLSERLEGLDRASPPQDLRARIADALEGVPTPTRTAQPAPSALPRVAKWRPTHWLPLAASLLVGVTVGYLLQPGSGMSVDASRAAGTMSAAAIEPATRKMKVDLGGPAGSVTIRRNGAVAALDIDLGSDTDLEVEMEVAQGFLLVTGIGSSATNGLEVTATNGKTIFRTRGPAAHSIEITATIEAVPVRLIVRANGLVRADDWFAGDADGDLG
jgi:hypothetical protein